MKPINYSTREYNGTKIMDLKGDLSANTAVSFENEVIGIIDKESLIINMVNIGLVTSAGLNSLVDVSFIAKDRGRRIVLLWASEDFLKLADTMDVYGNLIFADSPEEGQTKIHYYT